MCDKEYFSEYSRIVQNRVLFSASSLEGAFSKNMLVLGVKLFIKSADILKYAEEQGEICESRFVSPCLGQLQCLMFYLHSLQDLKGVECGGRWGGS